MYYEIFYNNSSSNEINLYIRNRYQDYKNVFVSLTTLINELKKLLVVLRDFSKFCEVSKSMYFNRLTNNNHVFC